MTRFTLLACAILLFVLVCIHKATSMECNSVWSGCNIINGECDCSHVKACENPFQYKDIETCVLDIYGDVCKPNPCSNGGICTQTRENHFECKCQGTGHYGKTCELRCPKKLKKNIPDNDWELGKACITV